MALTPLADTTDLSARGTTDGDMATALEVASSLVREAAGSSISSVTDTVTLPAPGGKVLGLPTPVSAVTAVTLDGAAISDYQNIGTGLWRRHGWGDAPVPVTVSATFGLAEVPADIVELTCTLAKAWLDHKADGGGSTAGLRDVAIDDAREGYTPEASSQMSPVFIPAATADWLRARFGGSAAVVETL